MPPPAVSLVHVRWALRRDLPALAAIAAESHLVPWSASDFLSALRVRACISLVAECGDDVCGYLVYELHPSHLRILNTAVMPAARRRGVGTALVDRLKFKVCAHRRTRAVAAVWDGDLSAHLFFRAQGFRAAAVADEHYEFEWRPTADERARAGFPVPTARPVG